MAAQENKPTVGNSIKIPHTPVKDLKNISFGECEFKLDNVI